MSTTRPEVADDGGVIHRHGCTLPGWTVVQSRTLPAWRLVRCADCGALNLARGQQAGEVR